VPFGVFRQISVTALAIEVSTASAGTAELAIYSTNSAGNTPSQRLAYVSGLDTGTTGVKSGSVSLTLEPGAYFAALRCSAGATLRAFSTAVQYGVVTGGATFQTHFFNSDTSLSTNPTVPLSAGTGNIPIIHAQYS
jgi:hypothetical protein